MRRADPKSSLFSSTLGRAALVVALGLVACTEIDKPPPSAGSGPPSLSAGGGGSGASDGGASSDAATDADTTCTDLANAGVLVDRVAVQGDPPLSSGGALTDGTFVLTDASVYVGAAGTPGPTGIALKETVRITGNVLERVVSTQDSAGTREDRSRSQIGQNSTTLVVTTQCPSTGVTDSFQFSVPDVTQLVLTNIGTKERLTYLRK